jgi:hypothetical protein
MAPRTPNDWHSQADEQALLNRYSHYLQSWPPLFNVKKPEQAGIPLLITHRSESSDFRMPDQKARTVQSQKAKLEKFVGFCGCTWKFISVESS